MEATLEAPPLKEPDFSLESQVLFPPQMQKFPRFRYMGSKFRLLEWLHTPFSDLQFESCIDAFSGSGAVSYFLKSMGKKVINNDSLNFPCVLSAAIISNNSTILQPTDVDFLLSHKATKDFEKFIQITFHNIFYTHEDLSFLDNIWVGIRNLDSEVKRNIAIAALLRSCIKRQPRGLFTVAGDPEHYKDGRRDLQLTLKEHFLEQVEIYNAAVFSNEQQNHSMCGNVFDVNHPVDLAYFAPPYVPKSDDNCYIKRYHFLEGLSCYWENKEIMQNTKVKKIAKSFTPFSYRRTAMEAFDQLFRTFADSTQVLSYSSNAFPDLTTLTKLMSQYKSSVEVLQRSHRYHFGTHTAAKRNLVEEFLIIGQDN